MAFGFNYEGSGNDIVPVLKFDARAGRFFRVDRSDGVNNPVDVTQGFKAVMDFENIEVGFINFPAGAAPEFRLVPIGSPMPENPGGKFRQGIRMMLKLGKESGGDIREIATTAKAVLSAFDACHTAYMEGVKENPGKLPVVELETTNYSPVFKIVSWVKRPDDLVFVPKGCGNTAAPIVTVTHVSASATPPSTGSTQVSAPVSDDDDFG